MVYIDDNLYGFDLAEAIATLPPQRREQALRFRYELGQRQCVLAYALLRRALQAEYGLSEPPTFDYGPFGKPALAGHPEIFFNLSHCRHAVACAVSSYPIGVDVESVREYKESLVRYTMNDDELTAIQQAPHPALAFTRLWTMKEARLKLTGEGIREDLKLVLADKEHYRFTTCEDPLGRYVYTVCEH